ncbi:MAG: glycosyl transferase family 52 [Clostridia bacterium]|nr:glycosyl transferase family 52 [Clostridia bacterium]NCD10236.1 glycosyl transferase family 52 [Negativicutes bacterium]
MKNLFIVHTPFNLMTAFILSKSVFADDDNYLAIMHPQSFESWKNVPVLNYMHSKECGYKEVFLLIRWFRSGQGSYRKQVKEAKTMIGDLNFDKIFLAVDIDIQAQLLLAVLGKTSYYRYDEGMWSYYSGGHSRTWLREIFHLCELKAICFLAGIKTDLQFNTAGIGVAGAALGDYLYRPELLMRKSPKVYEITNEMIGTTISDLKDKGLLQQQFDKDTVLYLSQPLVEKGEVSEKEELAGLLRVMKKFDGKAHFLYKPHAIDTQKKIEKYKKAIPGMEVYDSKVPVELLSAAEPKIDTVISYASSGLMFGDKFSSRKINMLSLSGLCEKNMDPDACDILQKAGVLFIK